MRKKGLDRRTTVAAGQLESSKKQRGKASLKDSKRTSALETVARVCLCGASGQNGTCLTNQVEISHSDIALSSNSMVSGERKRHGQW